MGKFSDNVSKSFPETRFVTEKGIAYAAGCSVGLVRAVKAGVRKDRKGIADTIETINQFFEDLREKNLNSDSDTQ